MVQVVLLHGVGGSQPQSDWVTPLNARLSGMGAPTLTEPPDKIVVCSYGDLFTNASEGTEPPDTCPKVGDREALQQRLEFWARQKELERIVRPYAESSDIVGLHDVPDFLAHPLADLIEFMAFDRVRSYIEKPALRFAIWRRVLAQMPKSGHVILVAHSLGSVVAAGVLRRLPPDVTVDLLVTIGSPLGIPRYRSRLEALTASFPYERVQRWLNIHGLRDLITGGRGVSAGIPAAVDVAIQTPSHSLGAYMSHPALAAAIRAVAFPPPDTAGEPTSARGGHGTLARPMHPAWFPLLLGTAFTWQVAKALPPGEWPQYLRLEAARSEVARRAVADIGDQRGRRAQAISAMRENGVSLAAAQLHDHPLADNRYPTLADLTTGAASILRGAWSDDDLLPFAVGLMLQPLVEPFDIQASLTRRSAALVLTLNVVRDHRGNLADQTYAEQVRRSVEWSQGRLADNKFPWGTVLIAGGLVVLAATGIGLVAAAPAGLAGAAVVTSTLAAFGPGGMVGGLVTLGALTGSAGALGALGVSAEIDAGGTESVRAAAAAARTAADLAPLTPESLTVTLTGMLAVIHAQTNLDGFRNTEPFVRAVITGALDSVRAEHVLHEQIAPGSEGTKRWARKVTLLERAISALDTLTAIPDVEARITVRKALETGHRPAELPETLPHPELPPAPPPTAIDPDDIVDD